MAFASLIALLAAAQVPPPVISTPPAPSREMLTTWQAGEIRCDGVVISPLQLETPFPAVSWAKPGQSTATLSFRIDAEGRPVGIAGVQGYGASADLAPALAVSRFAPGVERRGCSIPFTGTRTPVAESSLADAIAYTIIPDQPPSEAVWDRIRPVGTTCVDPSPFVRTRAYPDFAAIVPPPGTTSWSMVFHDIDTKGRPTRVRLVAGSGNATLDRGAVEAVRRSRFSPSAKVGCTYRYWRSGEVLPAPAEIDTENLRPAGANCPTDIEWVRKPVLNYPENLRRRQIEGWALIGFDVAPWGATGNARVLAAEPTAEFGEYGLRTMRAATKAPSPTGFTGCVERVRFVMEGAPNRSKEEVPPS